MSYLIRWSSQGLESIPGKDNISLANKTFNASSSSLVLTGKGLQNYGLFQQENFLKLLENFASATPPVNPTIGQIWYNTDTKSALVYSQIGVTTDGEWAEIGDSIDGLAPLASPAFTGVPTAPTASAGTSTTQIATTAFVTTGLALKANIASPAFTGTPTAPTASVGTNTTQIATTAFARAAATAAVVGFAPLASPAFTGTPTAPTVAISSNNTSIATTAAVSGALSAGLAGKLDVAALGTTVAPLASPAFTGTPTSTTAPVGNDSTRIATTAFVLNQASDSLPNTVGQTVSFPDAFPGTSTLYARHDHKHIIATDVILPGNPTTTTQAAGNNTTRIATTAFVTGALALKANLESPTFTGLTVFNGAPSSTQVLATSQEGAFLATCGFTHDVARYYRDVNESVHEVVISGAASGLTVSQGNAGANGIIKFSGTSSNPIVTVALGVGGLNERKSWVLDTTELSPTTGLLIRVHTQGFVTDDVILQPGEKVLARIDESSGSPLLKRANSSVAAGNSVIIWSGSSTSVDLGNDILMPGWYSVEISSPNVYIPVLRQAILAFATSRGSITVAGATNISANVSISSAGVVTAFSVPLTASAATTSLTITQIKRIMQE